MPSIVNQERRDSHMILDILISTRDTTLDILINMNVQ